MTEIIIIIRTPIWIPYANTYDDWNIRNCKSKCLVWAQQPVFYPEPHACTVDFMIIKKCILIVLTIKKFVLKALASNAISVEKTTYDFHYHVKCNNPIM